jgi:chromosomal replication initiator protein
MERVWQAVLDRIRESLSVHHFKAWFNPIHLLVLDGERAVLEVPNRFFRDWLTDYHLPLLEETFRVVTGRPYRVQFEIARTPASAAALTAHEEPAPPAAEQRCRATELGLQPGLTFQTFVVGSGNQFAHAAALAVASMPAGNYNPLFIYGGVGLGKTHLLNAIGHAILQSNPDFRVCYLSAEQFMNELINSIRYERMVEFRAKFRDSCDALLIDDVQFISGKERTQEEFFHTFNTLHQSHKQIVLTSDKFPKEILGFEERLRSRFEWGLVADIQPPDTETKVAILKKKAEQDGIVLPDAVALFLAENIDSNIRRLEGSLTRVGAYASLTGSQITLSLAEQVLQKYFRDYGRNITIEYIQKLVAKHFGIKVSEMKSARKTKSLTLPRQLAMYLCREYTNASFPRIGEEFGRKDHSTVIHAVKTIQRKVKEDPSLKNSLSVLEKELER